MHCPCPFQALLERIFSIGCACPIVRVKTRACSLDWNHLSHGAAAELKSAQWQGMFRPSALAPLTLGTSGIMRIATGAHSGGQASWLTAKPPLLKHPQQHISHGEKSVAGAISVYSEVLQAVPGLALTMGKLPIE